MSSSVTRIHVTSSRMARAVEVQPMGSLVPRKWRRRMKAKRIPSPFQWAIISAPFASKSLTPSSIKTTRLVHCVIEQRSKKRFQEWHYRDCVVDEKTGKLMHVQCAADADNILEESMITRTESISSIDELVNKPENEELEGIKSEPATTEPSQETELTEQSESMEVEATIVKAEEIKAEVLEEVHLKIYLKCLLNFFAKEDLYGDLAEGDNETSMITT